MWAMAHNTYSYTLKIISNCEQGCDRFTKDSDRSEGVWKGCAQGKNTKNPYPKSDNKAKGILDIIHSDICGPMQTTSLSVYV